MQVATPFTGIKPIKHAPTPAEGNFTIGVVGYPDDLEDASTNEKGAHMYEMYLQTRFNLIAQQEYILQYQIDTFGGKPLDTGIIGWTALKFH